MPYIDQPSRARLANGEPPATAGELNYAITTLVRDYLTRTPEGAPKRPRYADYNEALGVLEAAKLELYRRMVAPYEDTKIAESGDVYP